MFISNILDSKIVVSELQQTENSPDQRKRGNLVGYNVLSESSKYCDNCDWPASANVLILPGNVLLFFG